MDIHFNLKITFNSVIKGFNFKWALDEQKCFLNLILNNNDKLKTNISNIYNLNQNKKIKNYTILLK